MFSIIGVSTVDVPEMMFAHPILTAIITSTIAIIVVGILFIMFFGKRKQINGEHKGVHCNTINCPLNNKEWTRRLVKLDEIADSDPAQAHKNFISMLNTVQIEHKRMIDMFNEIREMASKNTAVLETFKVTLANQNNIMQTFEHLVQKFIGER